MSTYLWGNWGQGHSRTSIGDSPRSMLYVTSVLSLCDSKGLSSNLSVNMMTLTFTEAVWMPHSLWSLPDWPITGPESLHLCQQLCVWCSLALHVQNDHLLQLLRLDKAYFWSSTSVMRALWHNKRKKILFSIVLIKFWLKWHAFGLSSQWRPAPVVCSVQVHRGSEQGEWFPSRLNLLEPDLPVPDGCWAASFSDGNRYTWAVVEILENTENVK